MALNADPKPGRWILPLVVLGMVAFTYFFVRALPSGSEENPSTTTIGATDTTVNENGGDDGTTDTTTGTTENVDPGAQDYLGGVDEILASMQELQQEMTAVNSGFDADPREVEYSDAVDRLTALAEQADGLVTQLDELEPSEDLGNNHETIRTAVTTAAAAANEAVEGLQSDDDGTQRRNAVTAFETAVSDLETAVGNARSAAGGSAPTTDTTEGTTDTTEGTTETTEGSTDTNGGDEGDA